MSVLSGAQLKNNPCCGSAFWKTHPDCSPLCVCLHDAIVWHPRGFKRCVWPQIWQSACLSMKQKKEDWSSGPATTMGSRPVWAVRPSVKTNMTHIFQVWSCGFLLNWPFWYYATWWHTRRGWLNTCTIGDLGFFRPVIVIFKQEFTAHESTCKGGSIEPLHYKLKKKDLVLSS